MECIENKPYFLVQELYLSMKRRILGMRECVLGKVNQMTKEDIGGIVEAVDMLFSKKR